MSEEKRKGIPIDKGRLQKLVKDIQRACHEIQVLDIEENQITSATSYILDEITRLHDKYTNP